MFVPKAVQAVLRTPSKEELVIDSQAEQEGTTTRTNTDIIDDLNKLDKTLKPPALKSTGAACSGQTRLTDLAAVKFEHREEIYFVLSSICSRLLFPSISLIYEYLHIHYI